MRPVNHSLCPQETSRRGPRSDERSSSEVVVAEKRIVDEEYLVKRTLISNSFLLFATTGPRDH